MISPAAARKVAKDLLAYIDASPSPWHAVSTTAARLQAAGFIPLQETERWSLQAGGRYYTTRGGSALIAFRLGTQPLAERGYRLIAAHTDSPGLRLKPRPALAGDGLVRLAVEVYGGPILASFSDRDLGLAGRVVVRTRQGQETRLLKITRPLLRLANLAIHMNREVNENGLKFHRQTELPLLLSQSALFGGPDAGSADAKLRGLLGQAIQAEACDVLTWDLLAHDLQPGSLWGAHEEFISHRQLDNLASCHAATSALLATNESAATSLIGLFDHEEIGSESATGAAGSFLGDVLNRIQQHAKLDAEDVQRSKAHSIFISADMAHAHHPNYPAAHEPGHLLQVNNGPAIKTHAGQRYTSNAQTAARFQLWCEAAKVPCQQYSHRADLSCGSTVGPILAAQLGIAGVDVGNPMWSMHSARESAGAFDQAYLIAALKTALAS